MSRTSTALKRLGVAAVAAVTVVGIAPALTAPAQANHTVTGITLSPDADSAPTGTCNEFTATVTLSNGADTATVDVLADPRTNEDVEFCTLSADDTTLASAGTFGDAGANENAEFVVTEPAGATTKSVTFGIISSGPGTIDVTAFIENTATSTGNGVPEAGERSDTSVKTFTAGGPGAVTGVDAEPETGAQVQGQPYSFTARVTNAAGQGIANVTPSFDVISGPDAAQGPTACSATNQNGVATCTLTGGGAAPGTDTIRVFVNQENADNNLGTLDTTGADAGEPFDDITVTFQAPQAAGTTVTLTCASVRTNTAGDACQNPLSETSEVFTATVRNAAGTALSGVPVNFTMTSTGAGDNDGTDTAPRQETIAPANCTTGTDGTCTTTLTNPRTAQDETFTVTAAVQVSSGSGDNGSGFVRDTATKVFRNPTANEARNIDLTPATQNTGIPGVAAVTATVTDRLGNPVQNVQVTFTESGPGVFRNGSSTFVAVTDAAGRAVAELQSVAGESAGANTVTGTITGFRNADGTITERTATGTNDECEQAAGATTSASGNAPGQTAGTCSDTAVVNVGATASPSPSATSTATTPPGPGCTTPATVQLERSTIIATGSSGVTVRATPNSVIDLFAYSRPSTTFRVVRSAEVGQDGIAEFRITPPTNTRLYAQQRGCNAGQSVVLNVRTQLSLNVVRNGTRNYTFSGRALPARNGGLIVSLYRVTNDGRQILAAQTRANAATGQYVINRVFTGNGRFGFVVRTGQDLQNAPGASNVRSLLVF